jgi:D-inositol-3-phosphate glycosyltransferase
LVALESLACGTPVVATKVGGIGSIIRQGEMGYVVPDNSPRRLADKIALLLSRPNSNGASVDLMRASVAGFSWSIIAEAVAKECLTLLANRFVGEH